MKVIWRRAHDQGACQCAVLCAAQQGGGCLGVCMRALQGSQRAGALAAQASPAHTAFISFALYGCSIAMMPWMLWWPT